MVGVGPLRWAELGNRPTGRAKGFNRVECFQRVEVRGSCHSCVWGKASLDSNLSVFSQLLRQGVAVLGGQFGEVYVGVVNAQVLALGQESLVTTTILQR